jgi:hypothetical protein
VNKGIGESLLSPSWSLAINIFLKFTVEANMSVHLHSLQANVSCFFVLNASHSLFRSDANQAARHTGSRDKFSLSLALFSFFTGPATLRGFWCSPWFRISKFYRVGVVSTTPNPPTWGTRDYNLSGSLPFYLSRID